MGKNHSWILRVLGSPSSLVRGALRRDRGLPALKKADSGESCPPGAVRLSRLARPQFFEDRRCSVGPPPPPLLAVLQDAELSLCPTVGGGVEGSVSPPPLAQVSFWRQSVPPAVSHQGYRPSHHLPAPIPCTRLAQAKASMAPCPLSQLGGGREAGAETEKAISQEE